VSIDRPPRGWTDEAFDRLLGVVLQAGVLISATVVLCGGVVYLRRHGLSAPDYGVFRGEPGDLRSVRGIVSDARSFSGPGMIQLGVLLLIATPIARVAFSIGGFVRQRNWMYVAIAAIVLILLLYSLSGR
jgi:uncharacterized membrane protein